MLKTAFRKIYRPVKYCVTFFVCVFLAGPFVWSAVAGTTCSDWSTREYRQVPLEVDEVLAAAVSSEVVGIPVLPANLEGLAVPVTGTTFMVGDPSARLLVHEAIHHLQAEHDGNLSYASRYVTEFLGGLYSGCGPYDSYSNVSYEIQARRLANVANHRYSMRNLSAGDILANRKFLASALAGSLSPSFP